MPELKIDLNKETADKLKTIANKYGLSTESFVKWVTEETVRQSDKEFDEVVKKVLKKNEELY